MRTYDAVGFPGLLQPRRDLAPDFMLSMVQADAAVSLSDYRNRKGLFLGLFSGLYRPFCRRAIAQMAGDADQLKPLGIESLGVVATDLENARLYYRFRPMRLPLAVDPSLRHIGRTACRKSEVTPEFLQAQECASTRAASSRTLCRSMDASQELEQDRRLPADRRRSARTPSSISRCSRDSF